MISIRNFNVRLKIKLVLSFKSALYVPLKFERLLPSWKFQPLNFRAKYRFVEITFTNLIKSGKREVTLIGHSAEISAGRFNYDGSMIVSGSMDSTMRLWETKSGTPLSAGM